MLLKSLEFKAYCLWPSHPLLSHGHSGIWLPLMHLMVYRYVTSPKVMLDDAFEEFLDYPRFIILNLDVLL